MATSDAHRSDARGNDAHGSGERGFFRAHGAALVGSALLHAVLVGALLVIAGINFRPTPKPVRAIDGYIVHRPVPRPPPPAPPVEKPAEPAPPPEPTAEQKAQEVKAAQEAEQAKAREAEEQQARIDAEAAVRAKEDARRKAAEKKAEAKAARQRQADAAAAAAREADLESRLAREERHTDAVSAGLLDRYLTDITAQIERNWNRPASAKEGIRCLISVTQVPGGEVTGVQIGECNGDAAVRQSIETAVYRASPLPKPSDPSLFDRKLKLVFAPHD
jgi:outer membrane biosynthesis protein TonB